MIKLTTKIFKCIIPEEDKRQEIRLRRWLYAMYGAVIHTLVCLLLWADNIFRVTGNEFLLIFAVIWTGNLCFFVVIRSGYNKQFSDPSLTIPMMLWAITCLMYTVFLTTELRGMLLMFQLFVLVFGTFHLNMKAFTLTALYGIFSYLGVIHVLMEFYPQYIDMREEWISFSCFSLVSFAYAAIAYEMINIREYLRSKNAKLASALEYIESVSITDELTGIKNRRYILGVLEEQKLLSERGEYSFSILLLDIDFFKRINDSYGHGAGDAVLIALCEKITGTMRKIDYFSRYGGEEFLFVLPFATLEQAKKGGERIRTLIEEASFSDIVADLKVTVSIGATEYHTGEDIEALLGRVDKALYAAKNKGRNQVVTVI